MLNRKLGNTCFKFFHATVHVEVAGIHLFPAKLSRCGDKNAVATSWMMAQARGHMDVPSEPLGDFYWSMRQVTNACNFARGGKGRCKRGIAVDPLLALVWNGIPRL